MHPRPVRRGALGALAMTLLLAAPVAAHPFFDPDEVPVDSLAEVTLEIAHGCGVDDHDDGDEQGGDAAELPTTEVAIEVPEAAVFVDPGETEGFEVAVEDGDEGEVLVYTAEEGTEEPAPTFDLEVVLRGEVDEEVYWRMVQSCGDTTHRWVGTPDEPAEEPAVAMVLAAADDDAPPPPEEGVQLPDEDVDPEDQAAPTPDDADDTGDVDEADEPEEELDAEEAEDAGDADDGGGPTGWILIVVLLATLVVAGLALWLKGRDQGAGGPGDEAA